MKNQILIVLTLALLSVCSSKTKSCTTQQPTLADYSLGEKWVWKYKGVTSEGEVRSDGTDILSNTRFLISAKRLAFNLALANVG